ncbi:hypothetical protein [Bacillus toyonensis]|uniref:hypothetical protein n=1 Tax=Bacillus toyonensis TaxID=155322 RepID=UPI000BEB2E2A|nr:hypothetical protein [Bacillus toyonensis]PEF81433.1 hypothetical protein CON80_10135 [Bacillus toyonensis]
MNARQYFYHNVQPRLKGISYQNAMNIKMPEKNRVATKIWRHIPQFSNDRHVEDVIKNLLTYHIPQTFRSRLEHMFIAKLNSHEYQATALIKPGEYRGDLIYYYVGLADCLYEFSIYYTEFSDNKTDIGILQEHGRRLTIMANEWRKIYPLTIDLDRNLVVEIFDDKLMLKAAHIATLTDKFVICHEISHHLLGHTGKNNDAYFLLEKLPEELKSWKNKSIEHAIEFQADALATLFMMKLSDTTMVQGALGESHEAFEAILGCLLSLSVNRFLSNDPDEVTSEYPSDNERFESCLAILSHFTDPTFPERVSEKLATMFAYLKMLDKFNDLVENGVSGREIKSIKNILKLLLLARDGIKKES